jgi:hypothetical protein
MLAKMQSGRPSARDRGGGEVKVRVCPGRQAAGTAWQVCLDTSLCIFTVSVACLPGNNLCKLD